MQNWQIDLRKSTIIHEASEALKMLQCFFRGWIRVLAEVLEY